MTWELRVGAVQMRSTGDLAANLATVRELSSRAAAEGARLVALPECFSFLGRGEGDKLPIAETLDAGGPIVATLRELATKHGVWMLGGGTPEIVPGDPKRTWNTALVIDPRGELVARYRKIHLFDVDIPGGAIGSWFRQPPQRVLLSIGSSGTHPAASYRSAVEVAFRPPFFSLSF
jgi:predicted amidohydrolase